MVKRIKLWGYECYRCGNKWYPRFGRVPKQCPHCKNPYWSKPRNKSILDKISLGVDKALIKR